MVRKGLVSGQKPVLSRIYPEIIHNGTVPHALRATERGCDEAAGARVDSLYSTGISLYDVY